MLLFSTHPTFLVRGRNSISNILPQPLQVSCITAAQTVGVSCHPRDQSPWIPRSSMESTVFWATCRCFRCLEVVGLAWQFSINRKWLAASGCLNHWTLVVIGIQSFSDTSPAGPPLQPIPAHVIHATPLPAAIHLDPHVPPNGRMATCPPGFFAVIWLRFVTTIAHRYIHPRHA